MLGVAVGAGAVPDALLVATRVATGVPSELFVATTITLSPTAKLADVSADSFVPNRVVLVIFTVTVRPSRVRMVQLSPLIDWMVARKATRVPAAIAPADVPPDADPPAAGAGVAVLVGIAIAAEFDDVSDAVTAVPTPHAVSPDTSTTAMMPAATPVARGCRRNTDGCRSEPAVLGSLPVAPPRPVAPPLAAAPALTGWGTKGSCSVGTMTGWAGRRLGAGFDVGPVPAVSGPAFSLPVFSVRAGSVPFGSVPAGSPGVASSGAEPLGTGVLAMAPQNHPNVGAVLGVCSGNVNTWAAPNSRTLTNGMSIKLPFAIAALAGAVVLAAASAAAVSAVVAVNLVSATTASATMPSALASGAAGSSATAPSDSASAAPVDTTGFPSGGLNPGIFTDTCMLTKTLPNDPIMMPDMTGMSMQHDFFGNPAVDARSTSGSMVGGATSCSTSADSSAYWTPVLYQNGVAMEPTSTLIYWRAPAASASSVKAMPAGMTMIAGNEAATHSQSDTIIDWTCTSSLGDLQPTRSDAPHDCGTAFVRLVITFPNCWDGHSLGGKGQTNVVYQSADGLCPSSHPVQIPQIVMHVAYPTSTATNLTLSTGPTQTGPTVTGHADFMMGWNQARMDADVAACIDTQTRCGRTTGPLATPLGGKEL